MNRVTIDAQVITVNPVFPTSSDAVVITFNADKGNMGLKDYPGDDVYAHTGVITDQSTGGSDWKYVIATWGTNLPKGKAHKSICQCLYSDYFTLDHGNFTAFLQGKRYLSLRLSSEIPEAAVTGRDVGGTDIFYDVSEAATFQLMLSQPDSYTSLVNSGQMIPGSGFCLGMRFHDTPAEQRQDH